MANTPNAPYILQHTAEEIDSKLDLINENKNLLEYPYIYSNENDFINNFEDVGDGSFRTIISGETSDLIIPLHDVLLPVGTYDASLVVTTFSDEVVDQDSFSLSVTSSGTNTINNNVITINDEENAVEVSLVINGSFEADWFIKPQISKTTADNQTWVPHMDKVGHYVDRRFNGTNAKIRQILKLMDCLEIEDI